MSSEAMGSVTEQSIAARIERLPFSRWHVTVTVVLGVAIFFDSFDSLAIAYVMPVLIRDWHIAPQSIGSLISIANLGQAVGALFFGWLAERIGRVPTARLTIALYGLMSLGCAFAQNYDQLFWLRFVEGIGLGGEIPVASAYISEILRAERRGGSFIIYQIIFPLGFTACAFAGAIIVPRFGWQWMFIIGVIPAALAVFLQGFCPESPRWLASRGRIEEADRVMKKIERIVSKNGTIALPPPPPVVPKPKEAASRWQELFEGRYLSRTLIVWVLWASAYIVSYGMQTWLPSLYREVYKLPLQTALNYSTITNVFGLVGPLIAATLIDRAGRRKWFIAAFFFAAAGLAYLWFDGASTAKVVLWAYSFCFIWISSMNLLLFLYTAEIYPTRMRALGVSWASFWLRIAAAAGPFLVGVSLPRWGITGVFLVFAIIAVIGCVVSFFMVETRKRVLEEVSP
ncbi:MAG TPA: MFS transporter [Stellaceae bacterium]|jgi:putative MFS transporter|nr:MFS transporter [Stellaceae bacterium]